jgi:hypothetical protein
METTYLSAPGLVIESAELRVPKAREFAGTLLSGRLAFITLVDCRREETPQGTEVVVMDVEVERGQRTIHDIRRFERMAVRFFTDDRRAPEVLALRGDFPLVPHLNLQPQALPRSLCLFDEPYDDIKLRWTAAWFAERIRTWLAMTARGELHAPDQPLEPLLLGAAAHLILPGEIFGEQSAQPLRLAVYALRDGTGKLTYMATTEERAEYHGYELACVATVLWGDPQAHGVIQRVPQNIKELHDFMQAAGVDTLGSLRERLKQWQREISIKQILDRRLIIIVFLPKTRATGEAVEATDIYAFVSTSLLGAIGEQIGAWQRFNGVPAPILDPDATKQGDAVDLVVLNPTAAFSRERAVALSGLPDPGRQSIAAIGLGALGSQVFMNLLRTGVGPWALMDKDTLLPHNLGRHALDGMAVGFAKAETLATVACHLLNDGQAAAPMVVDVLHPGKRTAELTRALTSATTILDMAASVPVARALACDHEAPARRMSLFLNPAGTDVVLLAEDADRAVPLDMLEMQYYRLLVQNDRLTDHLHVDGRPQRYARSCRDVSAIIPQDLVALHAGIGSRALRAALGQPSAQISIWQADPDTMTVTSVQGYPEPAVVQQEGDWTILTDTWLLEQLYLQRGDRLPRETGGVLVGAIDPQRRRVYVVLSLPSPPDSVEWPTLYIRGCQGLYQRVAGIDAITAGQLGYVAEWHSHPSGHSCAPSNDDWRVLRWLTDERAADGLPGLMAIVGDNRVCWYLEDH